MMQGMSQQKLGQALGVTCQQVQKYEKVPPHRAGRLQHIASIQQVSISFYFEDAPGLSHVLDESSDDVSGFLATSDGLCAHEGYMHIRKRHAQAVMWIWLSSSPAKTNLNRSRGCG